MLLTTEFVTAYPPLVTALSLILLAGALAGAAALHNRHLKHAHDPVEYEVVKGVLYTLAGVAVVSWLAALIAVVAFCLTGGLMVWGARLRAAEREHDTTDAVRDVLTRRTGGPNA